MKVKLLKGNNIHLLRTLEPNSIDSVITDPPYGLEFMNKKWDYDVPSVEFWKEVYRVLKPGGHILSFGGTRTYHRMVVNIEDAGFEIRDCIQWIYGSGFPKSLNIGKTIDKLEGNQREVIGDNPNNRLNSKKGKESNNPSGYKDYPYNQITKGQTQWEGWGTGLKPANEPIVMARKPIDEDTIAKNVLEYGTGGINIDGCRVGTETIKSVYGGFTNALVDGRDKDTRKQWIENSKKENGQFNTNKNDGRFPANVILECTCDDIIKGEKGEVKKTNRNRSSMKDNGYGFGENIEAIDNYNDKGDIHTNPKCPCYIMDEQSGISISSGGKKEKSYGTTWKGLNTGNNLPKSIGGLGDKGGASRFFYQAKVSKKERNMGLDNFDEKLGIRTNAPRNSEEEKNTPQKNNHPTVKPINLLTYLVRLITPPNGVVLDAFMGSGSTGIAALLENKSFIGMEMDDEYFNIAQARINKYEEYRKLLK